MVRLQENLNIFGDNIAKLESFDFSKANISEESRVLAVTTVASICYGNPKGIGKVSLYDRLACESIGLPSSGFEFVPVLLTGTKVGDILYEKGYHELQLCELKCMKFGEFVEDDEASYLLTNLRALIEDVGTSAKNFFNTEEECEIIAKHFKVFRAKIDLPTRSQLVRHRMSFQELSRRYVSGDRQPFDFYVEPKLVAFDHTHEIIGPSGHFQQVNMDTEDIIGLCVDHYNALIASGVKPQAARRVIPQAAYSDIWIACLPSQYENFLKQRLDEHAQYEIRQLAKAMQE